MLWHLGISPYSEKVRWALVYKAIEHERRTAPPGAHMLTALWLTRGGGFTFPILALGDETVAGSAAIIGALETYRAEPPLYPEDPVDRRHALELEAYLDERLGPAVRLIGWHHMLGDRERMAALASRSMPGPLRGFKPASGVATRVLGAFVNVRFGVGDEAAEASARERVLEAVDRLEAELGDREYLCGDAFSVADLTAASLLYPLVLPPEGPRLPSAPESVQPFLDELRPRPVWGWVERLFARHRRRAPASADS